VVTSLDQGVGVDAADATGETPLMAASLAGHSELVAVLIKRGAKIGARNDRGLTALDAASYAGDLQSVQLLVQAGASVNDADNKFKVTPLILSAEGDHPSVINYLVEHGADLELRERGGYTALSRAIFKKHEDAIHALLKDGAACQSEEIIGAWALDCAKKRAAMPQ
jgi:ankyrin repeat protein